MIKRGFLVGFAIIVLSTPFSGLLTRVQVVNAQSSFDPWTPPVNISQSGSTSEPSVVLDAEGALHVFWYDIEAEEFVYSGFEGGEWSKPVQIKVPFKTGYPLLLLNDPRGVIHAFWIDNNNKLSYGYISIASLKKAPVWSRLQALSDSVMGFDAKIDSKGIIHLTYIRVEEASGLPAGIYYRSNSKLGGPWTKSSLLYGSPYFRSLDKKSAHVDMAISEVNENANIFIGWDNRPLKQIFLTKSTDGGKLWEEPQVVDGPTDSLPVEDPFHLKVHAYGSNVLLVWQSGLQSGFACTQQSQFSSDLGANWQPRQIMQMNVVGCAQDNQIFTLGDGAILLSTIQDQGYLVAWNGQEWSEPQPQSVLSGFTAPDTFDTVLFRCQQTVYDGKQLFVVGCDIEGASDIWITSRSFGSLSDWFGVPASWINPIALTDAQDNITSPVIICTPEGQKHVFWSQTLEKGKTSLDKAIFYTKQDQNGWSRPTRVLNTPDTRAVQPVVRFDNQGHLVAVWSSGGDVGSYSNYASIDRTQNVFNWSEPVLLPSIRPGASSPDIQIDQTGGLFAVYAIRVNEDRGIYLTKSTDGGKTWGQPVRVFDAVAANWNMVDQPKLAQTSDGRLHLIWTQNSVSGGAIGSALYYAKSDDDGQTWSPPQLVIEEPLGSVRIITTGGRTVHVFWLSLGNVTGIFHQFSTNSGETWSTPENISGAGDVPKAMSVIADSDGRLHLFQAIEEKAGYFLINYLVWTGAHWSTQDKFDLGNENPGQINELDTCLDSKEQLATVYAFQYDDASSGKLKDGLYLISHPMQKESLEIPALQQLVLPTEAAQLTPNTPNTELASTPTAEFSQPANTQSPTEIAPSGGGDNSSTSGIFGDPWVGMALGSGLAFILIILAFSLIIRNRRKRQL